MAALPAELKQITPFLTRANELAKAEPAIGYWCTYYAVQQAIALGLKAQESTLFLLDLLDKLEEMKKQLAHNEAVSDEAAASAHVENFALKIFGQADAEDRAGNATKLTAKKFLAAANFLELLSIFGEIDPEDKDKIKYSKWKASDIAKALREGRAPVPGPAGGLPADLPPPDHITEHEATLLAKELAALGSADDRIASHNAASAPPPEQDDEPSYPFPKHPTTDPSAPIEPSAASDTDEQPVTPAFPSFLNTPITTPGAHSTSSEEELPDFFATTPPATHQTSTLEPPANFISPAAAFPAAVFPSAPPLPPSQTSYAAPPALPPAPTPQRFVAPPPLPPLVPAPAPRFTAPPPAPRPIQQAVAVPTMEMPLDPSVIATIQKHAKWAISALNYDDLDTARKELRLALELLG